MIKPGQIYYQNNVEKIIICMIKEGMEGSTTFLLSVFCKFPCYSYYEFGFVFLRDMFRLIDKNSCIIWEHFDMKFRYVPRSQRIL